MKIGLLISLADDRRPRPHVMFQQLEPYTAEARSLLAEGLRIYQSGLGSAQTP